FDVVDRVAGADLDLRFTGQHVKLRERQRVDAGNVQRVAHTDGVVPAAAPLASRGRTELVAARAQAFAGRIEQLRGERPRAHTRRVRFDHADCERDAPRGDARARR